MSSTFVDRVFFARALERSPLSAAANHTDVSTKTLIDEHAGGVSQRTLRRRAIAFASRRRCCRSRPSRTPEQRPRLLGLVAADRARRASANIRRAKYPRRSLARELFGALRAGA